MHIFLVIAVLVWGQHGNLIASATGSVTAGHYTYVLWKNQPPLHQKVKTEYHVCSTGHHSEEITRSGL